MNATIVHRSRVVSAFCALTLVLSVPVAAMPILQGPVTLRAPQIRLGSTALQGFLDFVGESINAEQDQFVGELLRSSVSNNTTYTVQVELVRDSSGTEVGLYNGHDASPTLMPVFPARASRQWFAVASFRNAPTRMVVNVFDANAALQGTTTYLGADRNAIGFYVSGPGGTFYSQDSRNPNGSAQCLFYRGTGLNSGALWLAFEEQPFVSSDRDFDDDVLFVEGSTSSLVPTLHASWGQLKARFR